MSKKVVRLTESQLRDMIKKVVSEQAVAQTPAAAAQKSVNNDPDYKTAWGVMNLLIQSIEGVGTNEAGVLKAVQGVTSQRIYNYLLQILQKSPMVKQKTGSNYSLVMEYILTDFQIPVVDKPMYTSRQINVNKDEWGDGGMAKKHQGSQITYACAKILYKYNEKEMNALYQGSDEDRPV